MMPIKLFTLIWNPWPLGQGAEVLQGGRYGHIVKLHILVGCTGVD